jgi:tRNA A-37 threonylcarbamoyl transferase component Bud32
MDGRVLGERWQLGEQLGAGAMGSVYRGRDLVLHREVAIKVLASDLLQDDMMLARFRREAMSSSRLVHPNIVTTLDFGAADDLPFIVMELVDGHPLERLLGHQRRLSIPRAVRLARDVARGLDAAHRAGIVHRDIKPGNIMITREGDERARIVDFGIAQASSVGPRLTRVGIAVGTPGYVAPEQLSGLRSDGRADLFSLGVTLYETLAGELPWVEQDPLALLTAILNNAPRDLRLLRPEVPDGLHGLVMSMLRTRADERPSSAGEVADQLDGVLRGVEPQFPATSDSAGAHAVLPLAAASLDREPTRAAQQLQWFTRAVEDEGGRIAQSIGREVLAILPNAESAPRLSRTHPPADVPRPSLSLHVGGASVDETGMAVGAGVRAVLRLARLAGPEEVLLTAELHDAIGMGWRSRLAQRGRFLLDTHVRCDVFSLQGQAEADPELDPQLAGLESKDGALYWRCSCGGHGKIPSASSTLLRVRCSMCSRLLDIDTAQPASLLEAGADHPLTSIVLTSPPTPESPKESADQALISALSGLLD